MCGALTNQPPISSMHSLKHFCISKDRPTRLFALLKWVLFNLCVADKGSVIFFPPLTQQDFPQWTQSLWFYILLPPSALICVWRAVGGYLGLRGFNTSQWKGLFQGLEAARERRRERFMPQPRTFSPLCTVVLIKATANVTARTQAYCLWNQYLILVWNWVSVSEGRVWRWKEILAEIC